MVFILDFIGNTYNQTLAVLNYVCFCAFLFSCAIVYVGVAIGHFAKDYKKWTMVGFITMVVLLVVHFYLVNTFQIPLLVPPLNTPYFTDFMHVIQYFACLSVIILCAIIFLCAILKFFDKHFSGLMLNAGILLILLISIHYYLQGQFGVLLIFPPNLW